MKISVLQPQIIRGDIDYNTSAIQKLIDDNLYNTSTMLPTNETQYKLYPDQPELDADIKPGSHQTIFTLNGKTFKVIICSDLKHIEQFSTDSLDFILFIFHFTDNNFDKAMSEVRTLSTTRKIPVIIASLVSDVNIGFSSYVLGDTTVSLGGVEGVLEIWVG